MLLKCRRRRSALVRSLPAPWTASGGRTSPELHMVSCAIANHGRAEDRQVLLHLPVGLSSRQTAHRRLSGAQNDRLQSHRQWLAVTAPAGRAYAVGRGRPHLPPGAPLLPNEAGAEEGGRRPKKRSAKKAEEATIHRSSSKSSRPPLSTTPYPTLANAKSGRGPPVERRPFCVK